MEILNQLADYFEENDIGTKNTDIHPGKIPSTPDNCIAIINAPGIGPHREVELVQISFQIRVRNLIEPDAIQKSWNIYNLLNRKHQLELKNEGIILRWCYAQTNPYLLGTDSNQRIIYITNYEASVYEKQLI